MHLTELVLQGIRCFSSPRKLAFKPGFNVVLGGRNSGKSTLLDVFFQLFCPGPVEQTKTSFASKPPMPVCRAGMSFVQGETTYRKVEDFSQGALSLSQMNPKSNAFEAIAQDRERIGDFFSKNLRVPSAEIFRLLFCSVDSEFPSHRGAAHVPVHTEQARAVENPQVLMQELRSMKKLHEDALRIKQMQYELDGLHKEIFELQDVLKKSESLTKKADEIKAELRQLGTLPELPEDLEARAEAYEKALKKREQEVPQLMQEQHELQDQLGYAKPAPLVSDYQFFAGIILALFSIIAVGVTIGSKQVLQIPITYYRLGLFAIAIMGIIVGLTRLMTFLSAKDTFENMQRDLKKRQEKIKTAERKFEVETTVIRNIMKALEADGPEEMFTTIGKIQDALGRLKVLEEQLAVEKSRPQYQKASDGLPEIRKKASGVEQDLQLLSSTPLDPERLQQQIEDLEASLGQTGTPVDLGKNSGSEDWSTRNISIDFINKVGRDSFNHPMHRIISVSAHALQIPMKDFLAKLIVPLDKNLGAFSFKNLSDPHIEEDGTFSVQDAESKGRARFEQLEPFKQDLCYFALKFTLLQFLLRDFPCPIVLDAPFSSFDERMNGVIAKSIKFLSQQTQVLLMTDQEIYAQSADAVQKL